MPVDQEALTGSAAFVSNLRRSFQNAGLNAETPYPAYALASLFAVSAPFSFGTATQSATMQAARAVASAVGSPAVKQAARASTRALTPFWQLAGLSAIFGGGGYMIQEGDPINGSGTVTAWSLMYLIFKTRLTLAPLPLLLTGSALTLGTLTHGSYYFDQTSWRGAVPGLTPGSHSR